MLKSYFWAAEKNCRLLKCQLLKIIFFSFLNQHTFPYLQFSDNNLALLFWPENVLPEHFSPAAPTRPWFHPRKVVLNPPGWKSRSVAELRAVLPFEHMTIVCTADLSQLHLLLAMENKWNVFALLRKFNPCCWKFSIAPEKEPVKSSVVGEKGYPWAEVSPVISQMTSGCVFSFELPLTSVLQSCTIHEELGSALLSWWCGLNKPRRLCQHFKTHFLLQMK